MSQVFFPGLTKDDNVIQVGSGPSFSEMLLVPHEVQRVVPGTESVQMGS